MKLPGRFVLMIEGTAYRVRRRSVIIPNALPHLIAYLLEGNEMEAQPFEAFGLWVTVEPCTDQGDDEPDPLADR